MKKLLLHFLLGSTAAKLLWDAKFDDTFSKNLAMGNDKIQINTILKYYFFSSILLNKYKIKVIIKIKNIGSKIIDLELVEKEINSNAKIYK